jgi:NADH:ubiquinone oxidoreductase subunit K
MTDYVVPLEGIGLLLTAALIGAVLIAMEEAPMQPGGEGAPTGPSGRRASRLEGHGGGQMTPLHGCTSAGGGAAVCGWLAGALTRRHAIVVLMGIELMLNAANLNLIAFWRYGPDPEALTGVMFVLFAIGWRRRRRRLGLALIIAVYRHFRTTHLDRSTG